MILPFLFVKLSILIWCLNLKRLIPAQWANLNQRRVKIIWTILIYYYVTAIRVIFIVTAQLNLNSSWSDYIIVTAQLNLNST